MKDKSKYRTLFYALEKATMQNPVTRDTLVFSTGLTDRKVREIIDDLRDVGIRVCRSPKSKGYWIAKNGIEFRAFIINYMKYVSTMESRICAMMRNEIQTPKQFEEWLSCNQTEMRI